MGWAEWAVNEGERRQECADRRRDSQAILCPLCSDHVVWTDDEGWRCLDGGCGSTWEVDDSYALTGRHTTILSAPHLEDGWWAVRLGCGHTGHDSRFLAGDERGREVLEGRVGKAWTCDQCVDGRADIVSG